MTKNCIKTQNPIIIHTAHGKSTLNSFITAPLLQQFGITEQIKFFIFPELTTHDGILGYPTLKNLGLHMDFKNKVIANDNVSFPFFDSKSAPEMNNLSDRQKFEIRNLLDCHKNIQLTPDQKLTAISNVRAEIKTVTNEPIYANYPIPFSMRPIAENLIQSMLENKIIRPSRSPYNAPIKIVEKNKRSYK